MAEPLSTKDLNCKTCTINTCRMNPCNNPEMKQEGVYFVFDAFMEKGCASHPLALQVLAQPVIEELEQRSTEMFDSGVPMMVSIKEAIALLRGEDK
jgi:hypothetical protein